MSKSTQKRTRTKKKKDNDLSKIKSSKLPPKDPSKPWRDTEGSLYMAKIDLLELENSRVTIDRMRSDVTNKKLEADKAEMIAVASVANKRKQANELSVEADRLQAEHMQRLVRIGNKYDANFLYHHSYNSESGKVQLIHPTIKEEVPIPEEESADSDSS